MGEKDLRSIPTDLYKSVALYLKSTRNSNQIGESLITHLKNREKEVMLKLTLSLLRLRLDKASKGRGIQEANLLAEERYILEAETLFEQRVGKIENALKNGQAALLTAIHEKQLKKLVTVRFLKGFDAIVGVDLKKYGPFQPEDIATIPLENAKPLISQGIVTEIWVEE